MAEYVLVLLEDVPGVEVSDDVQRDHVDFIDSPIARNLVLLGGSFDGAVGDASAAYLLACPRRRAGGRRRRPARPCGSRRPRLVSWQLVGVNPEAVGDALVVRPGDIG
jgi:hypothetical protein